MRLSSQEEYGLRCLLRLARKEAREPVSIQEIADGEGMTPEYVAKLMRVLREAGAAVNLCMGPWTNRAMMTDGMERKLSSEEIAPLVDESVWQLTGLKPANVATIRLIAEMNHGEVVTLFFPQLRAAA